MNIKDLLACYKETEILEICKQLTNYTLSEKNISYEKIKKNWKFVGNNPSNGSVINMLRKGEKGLIERITNGVDAVIEKKVEEIHGTIPSSSKAVIKKAFPQYYNHCESVKRGEANKNYAYDAENQVMVAVSDGSKSSRPTFDVVDKGTGIVGDDFAKTILSINKGNKLSRNKQYVIGAFGQGGSTSLSFASATLIISKKGGIYYFTIVRAVDLEDYKNVAYVYLTNDDGTIPTVDSSDISFEEAWINEFLDSESGTFIRMIEMNISQEISTLDAAKPKGLGDFINTELFDVGLPVSVYENRKNFKSNEHKQNRNSFGSALKICTWKKYLKQEYCGSLNIDYENRPYKIDYFAILPTEEDDWSSDSKCKNTFEQINTYCDPIIYTVNGQTVSTESFVRLKNGGLNQLRYRLLIVINLDLLGKEKYKFFTTDRSQIKVTDASKGLLQEVVNKICHEPSLIELNSRIAGLALSKGLDDEEVARIADQVKGEYSQYVKNGGLVKFFHPINPPKPPKPKDYSDHIETLDIFSSKNKFYKDEEVSIGLKTGAEKYVNQNANIYAYLDGKSTNAFLPTFSRGMISYKANTKDVKYGHHSIMFTYYGNRGEVIESNEFEFDVIDENIENNNPTKNSKIPNIEILCNPNAELILDLARNDAEGKIVVTYNNVHEMLYGQVYGKQAKESDLKEVTDRYLKPVILFVLFMGDKFELIETPEEKNQMVVNFIKAQLTTYNE